MKFHIEISFICKLLLLNADSNMVHGVNFNNFAYTYRRIIYYWCDQWSFPRYKTELNFMPWQSIFIHSTDDVYRSVTVSYISWYESLCLNVMHSITINKFYNNLFSNHSHQFNSLVWMICRLNTYQNDSSLVNLKILLILIGQKQYVWLPDSLCERAWNQLINRWV